MNSKKIKILTDEELVVLIQKSDHRAFQELYERYWFDLFRIALSKLRSREVCEELVQDLFANLWKRRNSIALKKKFSGYIHTALRYMIINQYNLNDVRRKYNETQQHIIPINQYSTEKLVSYNELFDSINAEIERLPKRRSEIFKLSRYEKMSNKEIAHSLQISPKTVENQITKAIKTLRVHLKEIVPILFIFIK